MLFSPISFCFLCFALSIVSFARSHFDCNILSIYEGKDISLLDMPMSSVSELRSHPLHSRSLYYVCVRVCASVLLITIANDTFTCKNCSSTFAVTVSFVVLRLVVVVIFDEFFFVWHHILTNGFIFCRPGLIHLQPSQYLHAHKITENKLFFSEDLINFSEGINNKNSAKYSLTFERYKLFD